MSPRAALFRYVNGLSRPQKHAIFLTLDTVLAPLVFILVFHHSSDLDGLKEFAFAAALSGMAAVASIVFGLPRIKLNAYGRHAVLATAKYAAVLILGLCLLHQIANVAVNPHLLEAFTVLLFLACMGSRYIMLTVLLWVLLQGQTRCRVLIYGAGDTGQQVAIALRNHPRIFPVAFLDDDVDLQVITVAGLSVFSPARLETLLRDLAISRVLLAMPSNSAPKLARITRKLRALGIEVQLFPSFAQLVGTEEADASHIIESPNHLLGRRTLTEQMPNVESAYRGRVILVSGAGGSVGSELCRQLMSLGPKTVVLYESSEIALYKIDRELRDQSYRQDIQIVPVLGSVADAQLACASMIKSGVEVVFHAAAYKHVPLVETNPVAGLSNNVLGTQIFAEAAIRAGVAKFVLISTDKAVRPRNIMGATKRLAELVVLDQASRSPKTWFSTVRFGNVLGSSGSVLPLFREQITAGGPVTLTHEDVTRYFMTLSEAARLVLVSATFLKADRVGDAYVLDMGQPIKIRDLAERMINAAGLTVKNDANPAGDIEIAITGLRQGEKLHEELLTSGQLMPTAHPKILRSQERGLSELDMARALNAIHLAVQKGDQSAARAAVSAWVEGFPKGVNRQPDLANNSENRISA